MKGFCIFYHRQKHLQSTGIGNRSHLILSTFLQAKNELPEVNYDLKYITMNQCFLLSTNKYFIFIKSFVYFFNKIFFLSFCSQTPESPTDWEPRSMLILPTFAFFNSIYIRYKVN